VVSTKCIDPWVLEFVVSNITELADKFEDTKGLKRSHNSKDRQYNGQKN
jgi:hypothetical protein